MNDIVRAIGVLGEQIERTREQATATTNQVDQARAVVEDVGAIGSVRGLAGLRERVHAVDMLLAQAALGVGELRRQEESLRYGRFQPLGRKDPTPPEPPPAFLRVVAGPWRRERRWRWAMLVLPFIVPLLYLLSLKAELPERLIGWAGFAVLAVIFVRLWDQERVRRSRVAWRIGARPSWDPARAVDPAVSVSVRRALRSVVEADQGAWHTTVERLYSLDEETLFEALEFVLALSAMAFVMAHDQQWPLRTELWSEANDAAREHPESGLSTSMVYQLLTGLADRRCTAELPNPAPLLIPALRLTGWLMLETPLPQSMTWRDYLGEIELSLGARA
jgi:hypothetical protein